MSDVPTKEEARWLKAGEGDGLLVSAHSRQDRPAGLLIGRGLMEITDEPTHPDYPYYHRAVLTDEGRAALARYRASTREGE